MDASKATPLHEKTLAVSSDESVAQDHLGRRTSNFAAAGVELVMVKEEKEDQAEIAGCDGDSISMKTESLVWEESRDQDDEGLVWCEAGLSWSCSASAEKPPACHPVLEDNKVCSDDQRSWMSYDNSISVECDIPMSVRGAGEPSVCPSISSLSGKQITADAKETPSFLFRFSCSHCKYGTNVKKNLQRHLVTHQSTREKPFSCDHCEYRTDVKTSLQKHILMHDSDRLQERNENRVKAFSCNHCEYKAYHSTNLRRHLLTHDKNRVKPFPCSACEYKADSNAELQRHFVRHDTDRDKPFACHVCPYSTHAKSAFRRHLLTHSSIRDKPYTCNKCEYKTDRKCNLQKHVRTHLTIQEKPFSCPHCAYKTDIKGRIKRHILTHVSQTNTTSINPVA